MTIDVLMDELAAMPADDVAMILKALVADVNLSPLAYDERLAFMRLVAAELTAACRRRDGGGTIH